MGEFNILPFILGAFGEMFKNFCNYVFHNKTTDIVCPKCGSTDVTTLNKIDNFMEVVLNNEPAFYKHIYTCNSCGEKFT